MSKSDTVFYYDELNDLGINILKVWAELGVIDRGMIAGSVRRVYATPGDLELVIEPAYGTIAGIKTGQLDIFGENKIADGEEINKFENHLEENIARAGLQQGNLNGPRYKKFLYIFEDGRVLSVDVFLVLDPASWGMKVFIRTGPGLGWNKEFMTWLQEIKMHVSANRLHNHPKFEDGPKKDGKCQRPNCKLIIPTPTEEDVFKAVGLAYIPPAARTTEALGSAVWQRNRRFKTELDHRREYEGKPGSERVNIDDH